ncbi:MAG: hypothetical protein A2Y90_03310 [Chloroflexi bacterium RBG_13_52_12]|nr:MAG: hypothetical protein A2Y90_03310 [Chloroflexi bacterium RBG_13_52_12]
MPGSYNFNGTVRTFINYGSDIGAAVYEPANGSLQYTGIVIKAPAGAAVESPSVLMVEDTYYMIYHYSPYPGAMPTEHKVYMATSPDGITWSQHDTNKFICNGSVPGAVYYNGTIFVYYCGVGKQPGEQSDLGVAVSLDKGLNFTEYRITIENKASTGIVDPAPVFVAD